MANVIFTYGADKLGAWTTSTYKFALMKSSYTPNSSHDFMDDVVAGSSEISVSGYSRVTASTKTRTPNTGQGRIYYNCDDPSFGSLAAGQTAGGVVLFQFVTNDADSIPIVFLDITNLATDALDPFTVIINPSGFAFLNTT